MNITFPVAGFNAFRKRQPAKLDGFLTITDAELDAIPSDACRFNAAVDLESFENLARECGFDWDTMSGKQRRALESTGNTPMTARQRRQIVLGAI